MINLGTEVSIYPNSNMSIEGSIDGLNADEDAVYISVKVDIDDYNNWIENNK